MSAPPASRRPEAATYRIPPRAASGPSRATVQWDSETGTGLLEGDGVAYRVLPGREPGAASLLAVEGRAGDGEWIRLVTGAGVLVRRAGELALSPAESAEASALEGLHASTRGRALALQYTEQVGGETRKRQVLARLSGRSLELEVSAPGGTEGYAGFHLGEIGPPEGEWIVVPGLPDPLHLLPGGLFGSVYLDRLAGGASVYHPGAAEYRPNTDGASAPIEETVFITLSADPLDPLPSLSRPAAPFREALQDRMVVDLFTEGPFAADAELIEKLDAYGLHDVLLVYRNWQRYGFDRRLPSHYPADASRGRSRDFLRLVDQARESGWWVALRQEYAALDPGSPYWSPEPAAKWWDGSPRPLGPTGRVAVAAHRMLDFARLEAGDIRRNYHPPAVFVDGHTAWSPEAGFRQVDAAPGSPSGSESQTIRRLTELCEFLRNVHDGPVIGAAGEGPDRFDTLAAGIADGILRGPDGGRAAPLIVDYELREVRPRLAGIGAGSYRQFCGQAAGESVDPGRVDWDAYRATEIALGHTGYLGNYRLRPGLRGPAFPGGSAAGAVREYFLLRALQELWATRTVESIYYRSGDEWVDLAEGLRRRLDFSQAQVCVFYSEGLTVWVNRAQQAPLRIEVDGTAYDLPPSGFLAACPEATFLAYTRTQSGGKMDYCRCAAYTFVDTRSTSPRTLEGLNLDGAAVLRASGVPDRRDLLLVGSRQLTLDGGEYRLSERADVSLVHRSPTELEIRVLDSENGKPVHVSWPGFGGPWSTGRFRVLEQPPEGGWIESRAPIQPTRTGPQLSRVRPGCRYRVIAG